MRGRGATSTRLLAAARIAARHERRERGWRAKSRRVAHASSVRLWASCPKASSPGARSATKLTTYGYDQGLLARVTYANDPADTPADPCKRFQIARNGVYPHCGSPGYFEHSASVNWARKRLIGRYGDQRTDSLWQAKRPRFPADFHQRVIDKLNLLNAGTSLEALRNENGIEFSSPRLRSRVRVRVF